MLSVDQIACWRVRYLVCSQSQGQLLLSMCQYQLVIDHHLHDHVHPLPQPHPCPIPQSHHLLWLPRACPLPQPEELKSIYDRSKYYAVLPHSLHSIMDYVRHLSMESHLPWSDNSDLLWQSASVSLSFSLSVVNIISGVLCVICISFVEPNTQIWIFTKHNIVTVTNMTAVSVYIYCIMYIIHLHTFKYNTQLWLFTVTKNSPYNIICS